MCILPVYLEGTGFWCFLFSFNILPLLIKKKKSSLVSQLVINAHLFRVLDCCYLAWLVWNPRCDCLDCFSLIAKASSPDHNFFAIKDYLFFNSNLI